jgi:2Fe-2S ferredoxin
MDEYSIFVTDLDGAEHEIPALEGWRIMEIIKDAGLPIKAECGGACACATCHVYIDSAWLDKLYPKIEEENEMLDEAFNVDEDRSRLSCQILFEPKLNGLKVTLARASD